MKKEKSWGSAAGNGHEVSGTEVLERPIRRQFSKADKLRILSKVDSAGEGEIGAVLRREGIYSSHLHTWRQQREHGELDGYKPGRKIKHTAEAKRIAELECFWQNKSSPLWREWQPKRGPLANRYLSLN